MTTAELAKYLGKKVNVAIPGFGSFRVLCEIQDAKALWGNVDLYLVPMQGSGGRWFRYQPETVQKMVEASDVV